MATISTSITLKDRVSAVFKTITGSALESTKAIKGAGDALDRNPKGIKTATENQKAFNRALGEGDKRAKNLTNTIKGMAAAYLGLETLGQAIRAFVGVSDTLSQIEARLAGIVGQGQVLAETNEQIYFSAQRARTSYVDMADFIARVGYNAKDLFGNMQELTTFAETINKQFVLAGTGTREASMAMVQLSQALASGVLRGDELNSVFEQAPTIMQSIADYMNVPLGQIRDMASEGQLTSEIVKNAVLASAAEVEARFSKMPYTWAQTWEQFKNQVIWGLKPLAEAFRIAINTEGFREGMQNLALAITQVTSAMAVAITYLSEWDYIGVVMKGIAIIAGVVCVSALVLMAKSATTALFNIVVAAAGVVAKGVAMATAFLAVHPVILLLVNAFLIVIATAYAFGVSVEDIIATATGGFVGLGAVIVAVFKNAFERVKVVVHNTMEYLKARIISSFRFALLEGVVKLIGNVAKMLEDKGIDTKGLSGIGDAFSSIRGYEPKYIAGSYTSIGTAWANGVSKGSNFVHDVFGAFRSKKEELQKMKDQLKQGMNIPQNVPAYNDLATNLEDIDGSSEKTAENTKKIADNLKVIGFDIALLKAAFMDTAMRKIEQNVKLDINMPVTNANDVDLDGFVNSFVSKVQTELENTSPMMGQTGVRVYG